MRVKSKSIGISNEVTWPNSNVIYCFGLRFDLFPLPQIKDWTRPPYLDFVTFQNFQNMLLIIKKSVCVEISKKDALSEGSVDLLFLYFDTKNGTRPLSET